MNKASLEALFTPNVYSIGSVLAEPETTLEDWQIAAVTTESLGRQFHFYGRNCDRGDGRVSSQIQAFDAKTMCGVTRSGRVYQLIGPPGHSDDAEYVFGHWLRSAFVEPATFENGTEEFIRLFEIDLKKLER